MSHPEYENRKNLIISLIKAAINNPKDCGLYFRNQYAPETMGVWDKGNLAAFEVGMLPTILWNWSAIKKDIDFYQKEFGGMGNIINGDAMNDPNNPNFVIKLLEDKGFQDFIKQNEKKFSTFIETLVPHAISMNFFTVKKKEDLSKDLKKALKTNNMSAEQKANIYDQLEKAGFGEAYMKKEVAPLLANFLIEGIKHYPEVVKAVGLLPLQKERYRVDPALLRTVVSPVVEQTKIGETSYNKIIQMTEQVVAPKVPLLKEWLDKYPLKGGGSAQIAEELRLEAESKNRLEKDLADLNVSFAFLEKDLEVDKPISSNQKDGGGQPQNSPSSKAAAEPVKSEENATENTVELPPSNELPQASAMFEPAPQIEERNSSSLEESSPELVLLTPNNESVSDEQPIAPSPEPSPKPAESSPKAAEVLAPKSFWREVLSQIKDYYHSFISKVKAFFSRFTKKQAGAEQLNSAPNVAVEPPKVVSSPTEDNQPTNDNTSTPTDVVEPVDATSPKEATKSASFSF